MLERVSFIAQAHPTFTESSNRDRQRGMDNLDKVPDLIHEMDTWPSACGENHPFPTLRIHNTTVQTEGQNVARCL